MFLERIVGRDVTNPVSAKGFHDVHYLRQMLYCVFKSLHQAQRKLAFHHADLRLANIMELMPENQKGSSPSTPTGTGTPRSGRMQDASHHDSQHVSGVLHPDDLAAVNLREVARQPQAASPSGDQYPSSLQEATAQTRAHDPVLAHKSASMATMEAEGTGDLQDGNFKVSSSLFSERMVLTATRHCQDIAVLLFLHTACALSQAGTYAPQLHLRMLSLSDPWSVVGLHHSSLGQLLLLTMFQKLCCTACLHSTAVFGMQMIDFGLADFREVFGAGYVTGKHRSLIHNEPHHVQPLRQQNSRGSGNEQDTGNEEPEHRHLAGLRGNKGISKRSDAVPKGLRVSKFFPTPAGLLPQVSFCLQVSASCASPPPLPPFPLPYAPQALTLVSVAKR